MNINGVEICLPEPIKKHVRQVQNFNHGLSEEKWLLAQITGYITLFTMASRRKHGRVRTVLTALAAVQVVTNLVTAPEQIEAAKTRLAELKQNKAFEDIVGHNN